MTDNITEGGKCKAGKRRTKVQLVKMWDTGGKL